VTNSLATALAAGLAAATPQASPCGWVGRTSWGSWPANLP